MMLNALLGGEAGQTLSNRAAVAERRHEAWGCAVCWVLAWLIQPQHCADQLDGIGMNGEQYVRAFACLLVLAGILLAAIVLFLHGLAALL